MQTSRASELATAAGNTIRDWVMHGELLPGTRLREIEVANRLEMSRTPVRQAFQMLAAEGILDARPSGGVEVPVWTVEELDEIYQLRGLLESFAARRAAMSRDRVPFEELESLASQMTEVGDGSDPDLALLGKLNYQFHDLIGQAAGGPRLVAALTSVRNIPLMHRIFFLYTRAEMETTLHEHHLILTAIRSGDADWAESLQRAHTLSARAVLMERVPQLV